MRGNDGRLMDLMHALTLADVLREHRRSYPQRTAVVCGDTRLTWPQFDDRVSQLANALGDAGVAAGDRVLWLGQNCHRVLEAMLAAAKIGAVFSPANWRQTGAEFAFVIDDAKPAVVIWQQEEIGDAIAEARAKAKHECALDQHDGAQYEEFPRLRQRRTIQCVAVDPAAPALQILRGVHRHTQRRAAQPHGRDRAELIMANPATDRRDYVY